MTKSEPNVAAVPAAMEEPAPSPIEAASALFREPKASIQNIVKKAETWYPGYEDWQGKPAPDFTLTDIQGNTHKLSDYRGKNVWVVFFATWCGPCKLEIPHLKEVREAIAEDKLALLTISNESEELIKGFAAQHELTYTVLRAPPGTLAAPFNQVASIPSSFFVDPAGNIKLGTIGIVPAADAKELIEAR